MSEHESQTDDASDEGIPMETGEATIVYDDPEEGTTETTVPNEHVVYAQDHWAFMAGTDEAGNDQVRRVPRDRVHYVERNVQEFEDEVRTVRHRVESFASEVRRRLPIDAGSSDGERRGGRRSSRESASDRFE